VPSWTSCARSGAGTPLDTRWPLGEARPVHRSHAATEPVDSPGVTPRVPFPRYAVGLLQSESEMLQAPDYDLSAFLHGADRWTVELYTERTVHALLDAPERFDCVVVGYKRRTRAPRSGRRWRAGTAAPACACCTSSSGRRSSF
jgi:hypothetical protein